MDVIQTSQNTGRQLTPERIPDPVFHLLRSLSGHSGGTLDGYPLLSVYGFTGDEVAGDEKLFLSFGDEDSGMSVRFQDDLGSTCTTAPSTSPSASSAAPPAAPSTSRSTPSTASSTTTSRRSTSSA